MTTKLFTILATLAFAVHVAQGVSLTVTPTLNPVQQPVRSDVQLICKLDGVEETKAGLIWTKHSGIHKTGNVEVTKLDAFNIVLSIRNGSATDSGVYTCMATVGANHTLRTAVDIIFFSELRFVDQNSHVSDILATAAVNISCRVHHEEGERIRTTWIRHGATIQHIPEKTALYEDGAILEIKNYDPSSDPGEYTCRVENELTGNTIIRSIPLGGIVETRKAFCNTMCSSVCQNLYNPNFALGMF